MNRFFVQYVRTLQFLTRIREWRGRENHGITRHDDIVHDLDGDEIVDDDVDVDVDVNISMVAVSGTVVRGFFFVFSACETKPKHRLRNTRVPSCKMHEQVPTRKNYPEERTT